MIKPAYSVSFLLSVNIFVWQNVLYFTNDPRINTVGQSVAIYTKSQIQHINTHILCGKNSELLKAKAGSTFRKATSITGMLTVSW